MGMTISAATARLRREIPETEAALDEALLLSSQLMASMIAARREAGVAAATGQVALMRLNRTQQSLLAAQNDMIRVHAEMAKIGREMGSADDGECPPRTAFLTVETDDRIAA